MKIIFVISAMNGGGAERVLATLANRYVRQGDEVTILMVAGNESIYPLDEKVNILSIGLPSYGNILVQMNRLFNMRRYFKQHEGSVVVSFGTEINLFTIMSSLGLKNKVIVSERNDPNQFKHQKIRDFVYGFCKNFVFQTEDAKKCFPKKIQKNSAVIPNPVRRQLPEPFWGNRENKIAVVGRLELQKNHSLLLKAFKDFYKMYPEWELHIFGKGKLEQELKNEAEELGIGKQVFFEGFRSDVLEKIRTYGMYVLSSNYEGISNSLIESMAMGMPCISTDCPIGGSAMCIKNKENGMLVPIGDVDALAEAMKALANDKKYARNIGREALKIREAFGEDKIIKKWYEFIKDENEEKKEI